MLCVVVLGSATAEYLARKPVDARDLSEIK